MNLLVGENLSKSYGEKELLDKINFGIEDTDRIGLIGLNGTGKTTFLKIIAGMEDLDGGLITKSSNLRIEYLPQNTEFKDDLSVIDQVFRGNSKNIQLVRSYQEEIAKESPDPNLVLRLSEEMERENAWDLEAEAKTVLTKLGISNFKEKIGNLSGGQKRRVALASALINPSDLLILDEPTNHLDNATIEWLELYFKARKGAILMVTHDRYFLDSVTNKIFELDRGNLYTYDGNYNYYLEKKLEREESELASERKRASIYRQELAWIKRGVRARGTKQKARIDRFHQLEDSKLDLEDRDLDFAVGGKRLGRKIIEIENISKSYGDKLLIKDFSYTILRDDRIGILGENGSGKSTLIKIISGKLKDYTGSIQVGETVDIGVFDQESYHMDGAMRAIEYIKEAGEIIETKDGEKITAAKLMERFLFTKDDQWTPIGKLSGGERRRLQLLRILMGGPNVLVLDEPTNDLDISTLAVLEDYISEFPGPVIIVSHDRYLLDKLVDKVFVFEGQGRIVQYTGNYSYFLSEEKAKFQVKEEKEVKKERPVKKNKTLKFTYNEQREWDGIDEVIGQLEAKLKDLDQKANLHASEYTKLQEIMEEKESLETQLEEKMERWIYLSELNEKINLGE